jgi:hypothetical protein
MPRFNVGDTVSLRGSKARVVWLSENANEIEAIDEYIVEFEDNHREFVISSELEAEQGGERPPSGHDGEQDRDPRHRQTQ